jgi:hypothetical protein
MNCYSQKIKTPLSPENLSGKVKQVTEIILENVKHHIDGNKTIDSINKVITKYDIKENIVEKLEYSKGKNGLSGSKKFDFITKYKINGKRQEVDMSSSLDREVFKYDTLGNITQSFVYSKNDTTPYVKKLYKYNSKGDQVEYIYDVSNTELNYKEVYKYVYKFDKNGNIIEEKAFKPNGKLDFRVCFVHKEFDAARNWIKRISYSEKSGKKVEGYIYERKITYY